MEGLAILCVVFNGMTLEHLLTQLQIFKQLTRLFVHKSTVDLMLNQRHQNNHGDKPDSKRQHLKQHDIHSSI
jgi:hypothetical protein